MQLFGKGLRSRLTNHDGKFAKLHRVLQDIKKSRAEIIKPLTSITEETQQNLYSEASYRDRRLARKARVNASTATGFHPEFVIEDISEKTEQLHLKKLKSARDRSERLKIKRDVLLQGGMLPISEVYPEEEIF